MLRIATRIKRFELPLSKIQRRLYCSMPEDLERLLIKSRFFVSQTTDAIKSFISA